VEGTFHSKFDELGKRSGGPSPYYDGESLLAITKASKYLGPAYVHLWPLAAATASSLYDFHVVKAQHKDADSSDTKGCFQWLSMSLFELSTVTFGTGRKSRFDLPTAIQKLYRVEELGAQLVDLALWMVDVHQTLKRGKNTGYAYEGITPAWAWAAHIIKSPDFETDKDTVANARKLHCTIQTGMDKLISWQVGMGAEASDETWNGKSGLGGVQNDADESGLRIDVTQHQMHATILTRRYAYQDDYAVFPWIEAHRAKTRKAAARDGAEPDEM
jgi:UDP-N-acetylmuramoyl-tripeptide--D-alanyl-D-alanine ligase